MTEVPRTPGGPGHLFIVHGDLTALRCDDVLIPTDCQLRVTAAFVPLLASTSASQRQWRRVNDLHPPQNWQQEDRPALLAPPGSPDNPRAWLVNTAHSSADINWLVRGILTALAQVAATHVTTVPPGSGRERALIALPMMGIGEGGYARHRAQVIDEILTALHRAVAVDGHPDVALVLYLRSDYAVIQNRRRSTHSRSLPAHLDVAARDLAERAQTKQLVLFLGAGVSMAAGLPSWSRLITSLADAAGLPPEVRQQLPELPPADAATVIQDALAAATDHSAEALRVAVRTQLDSTKHALAHASLAGLRLPEAITTNYDRLYELAGQVPFAERLQVLPRDRAEPGRPWLLKLHGDLFDDGNDLVLTRDDYLKFDTDRTPLAAIVQSRLLTSHILFVGYSLADDNFTRLARQVAATLRNEHEPLVGTVLTLTPEPARQRLWGASLRYLPMVESSTSAQPPIAAARSLEIFLDHIAMYASSEPSYLMDPRYSTLLSEPEQEVASALHVLAATLNKSSKHHDRIIAMLNDFGA